MQFETKVIPIKNLKRNTGQIPGVPKNPRIIKDNNFRKLKESIEQDPEMLDLREIIAYKQDDFFVIIGGNMRFEALKSLNYSEVKCKIITDCTPEQLKRIILKDNSAYGEWDFDSLANEWETALLNACAIDVPELDEPSMEEPEAEEDNFNLNDVESEPITKPGEVYQLGKHYLFCGDSTCMDSVFEFMQGRHADMVLTDPPYNVNYEEKAENLEKVRTCKRQHNEIQNDKKTDSEFKDFCFKFYSVIGEVCKPGGAVYIWHSSSEATNFRECAPKCLNWKDTIIWNKHHFSISRKDYQQKYEPCLYFTKEGKAHYFTPRRNLVNVFELAEKFDVEKATKEELKNFLNLILDLPQTVINEPKPRRNDEHPTMKPVKLFGRLIQYSSRPGEIIFDCFGGSGTSIVAAEQLGRVCYTIEKEPHYCDVIKARFEKLTGVKPILIKTIKP